MIPFNLKEYLENPKRGIVTRRGDEVEILSTNMGNINFPILFGIKNKDNGRLSCVWLCNEFGHTRQDAFEDMFDAVRDTEMDLFFKEETML